MNIQQLEYGKKHKISAWLVHYFTMSGIIWASLAILALYKGNIKMMWLWLAIALFVDGVDGTFARKFKVKEVVPSFDGSTLDMVVDYITWTFIPALYMYLYIPLAPIDNPFLLHWLPLVMFFLIVVSSLFCYCNTNMKSSDYYFVGFPAAWNIVAVYFYILDTNWITNVVITIILSGLTLTKIKFLHPFRVKTLMPINIAATTLWMISTAYLIIGIATFRNIAFFGFYLSSFWFAAMTVYRTIQK